MKDAASWLLLPIQSSFQALTGNPSLWKRILFRDSHLQGYHVRCCCCLHYRI